MTTTITGVSIVAGQERTGQGGTLRPVAAASERPLEPEFALLTLDELAEATAAAADAFETYRATRPEQRADFLESVASEIEADGPAIIERAVAESGLPEARITGELARTTGQLRMFAGVVRAGDHLGVRIDPALPERTPLPRPDLRTRMIPVGPVAVFGASNFPLAFSTAGGDTASALAAGCPVVVKGHPAHPGTGELVARAASRAVAAAGLPAGVFSWVLGEGNDFGHALVTDPHIKSVGFTGSRAGGLALAAAAASRPEPIPVHAEMSSVNPVVVLPGALGDEAAVESLAQAYVGSVTLGAGQFCTNPGVAFVPSGDAGDRFVSAATELVRAATGQGMLTPGIAESYRTGIERLRGTPGLELLAEGRAGEGPGAPAPVLSQTGIDVPEEALEEVFGAASVVVRYDSVEQLAGRLARLEGQLTASLHCTDADVDDARTLLPVLETRVGRIVFNGWPTGVEVGHAMVHGGPFPATSDARTTSVGSLAIERFQRPVCLQDAPAGLLPDAVRDDNPWGLVRRVDGGLELPGRD
jgi:2,5-dioxopentanoate dehydrogenase